MAKNKTSQKDFILPLLTLLALPRYSMVGTGEVLPDLKRIMKMFPKDKTPFRGTQIIFDKTFYNVIVNRDRHFTVDGKRLVNFYPLSSGFAMAITADGIKYLKRNR